MYYLIIDTCVWISLGYGYTEIREKISDLVNRGKVTLIVPQIVVEEWDRHKLDIIERKEASIRKMIKYAENLAQCLPAEDAAKFAEILDRFQGQKIEVEDAASKEVGAIDSLLDNPSTIRLLVTEKAKLQAVDLALARSAPFQNKNSMADALIVLCAVDHIVENNLTNCVFVSSNATDFALNSDIHPDLKDLFEQCGMQYSANIALAINEIEENLVSQEVVEEVDKQVKLTTTLWEAYEERREELARMLEEAFRPSREFARMLDALQEDHRKRGEELARMLEEASRPAREMRRRIAELNRSAETERLMRGQEGIAEPEESSPIYVASTKSNRFHISSCRYAQRILPENQVPFANKEEAIAQGYDPCEVCEP